jgi:hypothetical protein
MIALGQIYECCKDIGLVSTQYEFSELCGRKTTWFSASKARNLRLSTEAALNLSVRLRECAAAMTCRQRKAAKQLSRTLMDMVTERAGAAR